MLFIIRKNDLRRVRISSPYGPRRHPITGAPSSFHRGIDLAAPVGVAMQAPADSVVLYNRTNKGGPTKGLGHYLVLYHEKERMYTMYGHMRDRSRHPEGSKIKAGEIIGHIGATGAVTGPHVHFEMHRNEFKFGSQVPVRGGDHDPAFDPFEAYDGLDDFLGKRSLSNFSVSLRPNEDDVLWLGEVVNKGLNVRTEPTTKGNNPVRMLQRGDIVPVYAKTGSKTYQWLYIGNGEYVSNARNAYVHEIEKVDYIGVVTAKTALNVRKGPSTDFSRVGSIKSGTEIRVYTDYKGWCYIGDGKFVSGKFVDKKEREYHIIKRGETLWGIASKRSGISSSDLMKWNNIKDPSTISVGTKIYLEP